MSRFTRRHILLQALSSLLLLSAAAACTRSATAPQDPKVHDDPADCRNGYTIANGVVVCNP